MKKIEPTEKLKRSGPEIEKAFSDFTNAVGVFIKNVADTFNEYTSLFAKHWQEVVEHEYNEKINKEGEHND